MPRFAAPGDTLRRRRRDRSRPAPPDAAVPPLPAMRRVPAPASRRRGLCRLRRRPDRRRARRAGPRRADPRRRRSRRRAPAAARRCMPSAGRRALGFTEESSHAIVDMRECHVLRPSCSRWSRRCARCSRRLRPQAAGRRPPDAGRSGRRRAAHGCRCRRAGRGRGAHRLRRARTALARLAIDDGFGPETRWEPEPVTITLGGVAVPLPPAASSRRRAEGEAALVAAVREAIGDARDDRRPVRRPRHLRARAAGQGLCRRRRARRDPGAQGRGSAGAAAGVRRASRPVPPPADAPPSSTASTRSCSIRRAPARASRCAALAATQAPAHRLCLVQSQQLRARCEDAVRGRLAARLGPAGRPVPLVDPCRAGRARSVASRIVRADEVQPVGRRVEPQRVRGRAPPAPRATSSGDHLPMPTSAEAADHRAHLMMQERPRRRATPSIRSPVARHLEPVERPHRAVRLAMRRAEGGEVVPPDQHAPPPPAIAPASSGCGTCHASPFSQVSGARRLTIRYS